MPPDKDENECCRILHKETLEVFDSLERLGDRFSDPGLRITDAEAEQSMECLRADLDRLSRGIKSTQNNGTTKNYDESAGGDVLLPAILGGLAVGAVIEKSLGGDFLTRQSISPP